MKLEIKVESYPWGVLRVVTNRSVTCVIHPVDFSLIEEVVLGIKESARFKDEQSKLWTVSMFEGRLVLRSGNHSLRLSFEDLVYEG